MSLISCRVFRIRRKICSHSRLMGRSNERPFRRTGNRGQRYCTGGASHYFASLRMGGLVYFDAEAGFLGGCFHFRSVGNVFPVYERSRWSGPFLHFDRYLRISDRVFFGASIRFSRIAVLCVVLRMQIGRLRIALLDRWLIPCRDHSVNNKVSRLTVRSN